MHAILQKISASSGDKDDAIQFRIEKEDVGSSLLSIRKGQNVMVKASALQTSLKADKDGVIIESEEVEFESSTISISLCVLEDGIIATVTIGVSDREIANKILQKGLRGQIVELKFLAF